MTARPFMLAAALVLVAGCTFIATFDEPSAVVRGDDDDDIDSGRPRPSSSSSSTTSSSSSSTSSSSSSSASSSGTPAVFPPACDPAAALDQISCAGFSRPNCASQPGFNDEDELNKVSDLVECKGGANPDCLRHCPNGCAQMPTGFPDQCDDCFGRADGFYCAKSLRNWLPETHGFAIRCVNGKKVEQAQCGSADKCADDCPTPLAENPARPACCLP